MSNILHVLQHRKIPYLRRNIISLYTETCNLFKLSSVYLQNGQAGQLKFVVSLAPRLSSSGKRLRDLWLRPQV